MPAIFSGASLVTQIFPAPNISRFLRSAFARELLISLENRTPVPANFAASSVLLPPGAAHKSRTRSPGLIGSHAAGDIALGSCK